MSTAPKQTVASPARVAANRANAAKSTGPRTEEGKARSRANAVKHGLAGAGVALPSEDAAAVERLFAELHEDLAPTTRLGAELVHQLALLRVRQHRARRAEAARLRIIGRHAAGHLDRERAEQADRLLDAIETHPRPYRRQLLATPEGVDRLVAALVELHADLTGPLPFWSPAHHKRLDALFGYRVDDLPWGRPTRFSRAILGDFEVIGAVEVADRPEDISPQEWAQGRTAEAIEAEVARLAEHRLALDLDLIAEDRADAAEAGQVDTGRDAALAWRYEAALARELSRTLRDYHLAESLGAAEPEPEPDLADLADLAPPPIPIIEAPAPEPNS